MDTFGVLAIVGNAAALIWGAAKLSASVKEVEKMAGELKATLQEITRAVNTHDTRLAVLEAIRDHAH